MASLLTSAVIAAHSNTCATTPRHIWMHQVVTLADVSHEDMETYCTRERMNRAYSLGEPVYMAANTLKHFVANGKRHARVERETNYLAGKMKVTHEDS